MHFFKVKFTVDDGAKATVTVEADNAIDALTAAQDYWNPGTITGISIKTIDNEQAKGRKNAKTKK